MRFLGPINESADLVTKAFTDLAYKGFMPPSGAWLQPANYLNSTTNTPTTGTVYWQPFNIGPGSLTIQNLGCRVTTVQSGGTVTLRLGLYKDNGTGGGPLLTSAGLLGQGTFIATGSTGNRSVALSTTLTPARYWGAFLYVVTSAPTTAPIFSCVTNASPGLWLESGGLIGDSRRALTLVSQTVLPTGSEVYTASSANNAPVIALQAA